MAAKNSIASAVASIRAEIASRKTEIEELEGQRLAVASAVPSREDLFAAIDNRLERDGAAYRRELHKAFDVMAMLPMELDERLTPNSPRYPMDLLGLSTASHGRGPGPEAASGLALALLMGDMLKEGLHRQVENFLSNKVEGLPLAARRAEIARLDGIIETKRQELSGLLAEAQAAGVVISP